MAQKTSINIKPCNVGSSSPHNRRSAEYLANIHKEKLYIRTDLMAKNEAWVAPELGDTSLADRYKQIAAMVKEKTGRAMQTKDRERVNKKTGKVTIVRGSTPLKEGVVVIKEDTTMKQLQNFCEVCKQRWGITALQIFIHRDEGHYINPGDTATWKPNLHAHIVWDWMNHDTGKSCKLDEKAMSEMQTLLAECLEMERGTSKKLTGKEHLERNDYILAKQKQEAEQVKAEREAALAAKKKAEAERLTIEGENKEKEQYGLSLDNEIADKEKQLKDERKAKMDSILDSVGSIVGVGKSAAVEKENAKLKAENERIRKAFPNAVKNKVEELTKVLASEKQEAETERDRALALNRSLTMERDKAVRQLQEQKDGERQRATVDYYDDQTDNYLQMNYQLLLNHTFSAAWNLNAALHYTKGDGYYQEYKEDRSLKEYRLHPFMYDGKEVEKSDLIRQKKMDNHFGGGVFSVNYRNEKLDASLGGALNYYDGWHFGRVIWVKNYIGELLPDHEYYRNKAKKTDGNLYLKANYNLVAGLNAYADLQYRYINYKIHGDNDKYDYNTDGLQKLAVNDHFNFFNPKAGLNWDIDSNNRVYASFSIAQKEPTRNNYTDGNADEYPKAEKLYDYELGYTYRNTWLSAGVNFYYMDYKDQLVLTGELNEIGEAMARNVPDSYRTGVELMLGVKPCRWFQWDINGTLSKNRVKNFTEKLYEDEWKNPIEVEHGNTPIAFSPDFILNNRFSFSHKGFEAALQSQYVSKQYMSNAKQAEQTLDAYFVSNLNLAYTFQLPHVKSVTVGFTIYNLFNEKYENNGYAGSGYTLKDGKPERYNYAGYAAQAGTNVMGNLSIRF